jgi:type I restriction enzyme S subunit
MGKIQTIPLNEICETIQYGYTASAAKEPVGPKFVRITDIVPDAIDWAEVPYCQIEESKKEKYALKSGDIVIARTGATTGYAKYLKNPPPSIFASYLVRVRVKEGVDPRYIGFIVRSDTYKRFIKTHMGGAAQPNANAKVLTSFPVSLPSLMSQKKIAAILSAYDDLIENNLRRIKILEEMAQTLYREWFVKFRFPGHQKVKMVDSPLGKIPEGWEVKRLSDVLELVYGKGLKKQDRIPGDVPVYGSSGVVGYHNQSLVEGPGIIVGRKGNVGSVHWTDAPFFPIDTVFYVITKLPLYYVYFNLQRQNFISGDAAVPGLNRNQAYFLPFILPTPEVLRLYSQTIEPIFNLLNVIKIKNNVIRQTRDLLLPKLISGELDVSELDINTGGLDV